MNVKREKELFLEAFAIESPADRAAFLDQACAGDPVLRQRVDALFEAQGKNRGFLEEPAIDAVVTELVSGEDEALRPSSGDTLPDMETSTYICTCP
jgi:hypothetical protein